MKSGATPLTYVLIRFLKFVTNSDWVCQGREPHERQVTVLRELMRTRLGNIEKSCRMFLHLNQETPDFFDGAMPLTNAMIRILYGLH
jgi:hypothetical protein